VFLGLLLLLSPLQECPFPQLELGSGMIHTILKEELAVRRERVLVKRSHQEEMSQIFLGKKLTLPMTVAARSKAWIVFVSSNTGIVGSNPTRGMDVCVRLFCV
jgi:hypothetical protein